MPKIERPLRSWLRRLGSHHSGSPVTLKEIYTRLTPSERQILRRMIRERMITLMEVAFLEVRDILEDIRKYVREQLREMETKRRQRERP